MLDSGSELLGMVAVVSGPGYRPKYHVGIKSFGLSFEDAQDKDDWRLRINVETGVCMCACATFYNKCNC